MNNPVGKKVFVGLTMPADLNKRIDALARAENNSRSSMIRRILSVGLEREETLQKERRAS